MTNNVYIATLKLTFIKSVFFDDNIYQRGEFIYLTKQFEFDCFSRAYVSLKQFIDNERDGGCFEFATVEVLSLVKVGVSYE